MFTDLVTCEVGDFDYGVAKSKTKPFFKTALAVSSTSHDRGDAQKVYLSVPPWQDTQGKT